MRDCMSLERIHAKAHKKPTQGQTETLPRTRVNVNFILNVWSAPKNLNSIYLHFGKVAEAIITIIRKDPNEPSFHLYQMLLFLERKLIFYWSEAKPHFTQDGESGSVCLAVNSSQLVCMGGWLGGVGLDKVILMIVINPKFSLECLCFCLSHSLRILSQTYNLTWPFPHSVLPLRADGTREKENFMF